MRIQMVVVGVLLIGGLAAPPWAAPQATTLQGVTVSAEVSKNGATGIFTYRYRVSNPAHNSGQIIGLRIEISRGPSEAVLSRDGLFNGPGYLRSSSEDAFQRVPMVPVGMSGPEGWISGLGFDAQTPPRGLAAWGGSEAIRILPGQTLEGFQLASYGLPGIRQIQAEPDVEPPQDLGEWAQLNAFYEQFTFRAETVGPKAPPQTFVPLDFLNYLITLLHDSRRLGWIKVDGVHQSLLGKLITAKRKLEAGDTPVAKDNLNAFLNEIRAVSCLEFSCPGNKPETSEAYALLYFNCQYLLERLP